MPSMTRQRLLWMLIIFLLGVQILWHRHKFKYLADQLNNINLYQRGDTDYRPTNLRRSFETSPAYSRHMTTSTSAGRLTDKRAIDRGGTLHYECRSLKWLQQSFKTRPNASNTVTRPYLEGYRSLSKEACQRLMDLERSALYAAILSNFTLQKNDMRDSFVNLHRYGYLVDSIPCKERPDVLILVHSRFDYFKNRELIRQTWASYRTVKDMGFRTVFFLGQPNIELLHVKIRRKVAKKQDHLLIRDKIAETMKRIRQESMLFGDIVMGNFTDSYRNLTIKHIMALDWVRSHCSQVPYVVKVDDDVLVNIFNIANYIRQINSSKSNISSHLACKISPVARAQRRKGGKWFVSESEYSFPLYPPWCLGYGVFMTRDVSKKLLEMSRNVRSYWIDDVYVTGFLRLRAGQSITSLPKNLAKGNDSKGISAKFGAMFVIRNMNKKDAYITYWKELEAVNNHQT